MRAGKGQRGFTLIAVLAAMMLMALALQAVMAVISQQAQREREAQLLRIGNAMSAAIGLYYRSSPGSVKNWPRSLDDLTNDTRFVDTHRYLREIYPDPITISAEWGIVHSPDGGIAGVFSRSETAPLRDGPGRRVHYSDWKFVFVPEPIETGEH